MTILTPTDGLQLRVAGIDDLYNPGLDLDATVESPVATVGSTGITAAEPLLMATVDGTTAFYLACSSDRLETAVHRIDETGDVTAADPATVVDHDPELPEMPVVDLDALDNGIRRVLAGCGWRRPANVDDYDAAGGFLNDVDPDVVFDAGESIHGRGWGDACHDSALTETWVDAHDAEGDAAVVINAHSNPGDSLLLSSAPFNVLDGAVSLAQTVDATEIVIFASMADESAVETAHTAVERYPNDPSIAIDVVTGPAEYRAAEPTMALEAIEGNHRLEARLRPPGPESVGLYGRPTLIHTARTLSHLAVSLREGDDDSHPSTRVMTIQGDVTDQTVTEIPETATIEQACAAADTTGEIKAACVGGRFGGLAADLDISVDPETLTDADLGTEGIVNILSEDRCVVEFVGERAQFASEENCGRCVPCREGTTQLAELLRSLYDGTYRPEAIDELIRVMTTTSICEFGVNAGRPARTALDTFESEFKAHADGQCPTNSCLAAMEVK
ncbi:NADH-ubiquinone oxidoreductase-F iron-sulfur binding region domain-containing protein [Haloquadratum walsbyi]|jgi:NADH:ubiquinone oxidoreductase, NADH-binding (51 kD) subunit|uniref:NADH:ubiquinone oxidoreductase, NADH-binding (51 kD) subunit n=1 Tax=Haloquadratum walsbyi J07HQW2 TaxID=1238425 RepID=U1NG83_9EURY|nr:NADH-ubiquinone oxidoreductase-F iron-sulfur binding region domain-containing protein [Haloquadratum walsbyi]ERG96130.1 MAG: NADH:ubiquinone oxidoreductase, NADH-binding (51 kD) subunit [Haloquadratum walsbyi J07HQW2]